MTRKEEIKNYAHNNCINDDIDDTSYSLIVETAEWADRTMIDRACSILEDITEGRLEKRFINEFKNKLKYGVLERH